MGNQEAVETKISLGSQLGQIVPVSDGVNPREENDRPSGGLVERDILVELDDAVEGRLAA